MKSLDRYFDLKKLAWDTVIRYGFMFAFGVLASLGYWQESWTEPAMGLVLALFTVLWYTFVGFPKEDKYESENVEKEEK